MTKKKHKKARGKGKIPQDVTVHDYANSSICNNRLKKPTTSVSYIVKNELAVKENWDDNDDAAEINSETLNINIIKLKNEVKPSDCDDCLLENQYPFDIWFLISNYIRPEDIGRFACICKTSLEVVLSATFWIALYKRYYVKASLPLEYQPECLLRYFGLRTSVIKSLFFMYPPFISRLRQNTTWVNHPSTLIGLKCIGLSFMKEGKSKCYYFKFKLNNMLPFYKNDSKTQTIIEVLNDIEANVERDHCILKIICLEPIAMPPIFGQTLINVLLTLSKGFCYHRLQLVFGSNVKKFSVKSSTDGQTTVVIDPVLNAVILNWWHPLYKTNKNAFPLNTSLA